jgi:predicted acetyltransferase
MLLNNIKLVPIRATDYHTVQNMARFYVYDISEYMGCEAGWELPLNGLYECIDFKKYWDDPARQFPFFIYFKDEIAGFVIIDKQGVDDGVDFNIAQFFVLRKFKRMGIGRHVAQLCFDRFVGKWNVMCLPGNQGLINFGALW